MLNIFAALVDVIATYSLAVIRPGSTPWSQSTDMRSSMPLVPLGILEKSSLPISFCQLQ